MTAFDPFKGLSGVREYQERVTVHSALVSYPHGRMMPLEVLMGMVAALPALIETLTIETREPTVRRVAVGVARKTPKETTR